MNPDTCLDLNTLRNETRPGLNSTEGGGLAECAAVCLDRNEHVTPRLTVSGAYTQEWPMVCPPVTNQMRRTHKDMKVAAEKGACGIAVLIMEKCDRLTVWERSPQDGGGFDYYMLPMALVPQPYDDNFFAAATHRLEVSGILRGIEDIQARINEKKTRLQKNSNSLPATIIVVEFGNPQARIERL